MVRGRGRAALAGAAIAAACLGSALAGCGASSHVNDPRPQVSTRISVVINDGAVLVQPGEVGMDEEQSQQIPQNHGQKQPPIKTRKPLNVTFVAANQTGEPTHLVVQGPEELKVKSGTVFTRSPDTFQASLPTGSYTVVAADVPGASPGHLTVGPYRASSQNDVLLP